MINKEYLPNITKLNNLRYFKFQSRFKLRWRRARDLLESQIPVTTGGFELLTSCIQRSYVDILKRWPNGLVG